MNKWLIALSVILPTLVEVIDTTVVNVSLGHIRGSLSAGVDEATWAITAYLVSNAIIIPMTGWLSRLFGRKRYLLMSLVLFMLSSFMCGISTSLGMLIFFRILQGIGGGALQPISNSILFETFPPKEHGIAMAIFGVGVMFGPIIGPILGGWITDNWSWRWIFYINIPISIISIMMIMAFIKDPPYLKKLSAKIDYWGLILITVGLGCLQVVLDKGQSDDWFNSPFIIYLSVVSLVSLVTFIFVELRAHDPVLNIREFKNIPFAVGNIAQFIVFGVMFGSIVLLPLFVQGLLGYSAYLAGLVLAPGGVATLIVMPIVGRSITKINPKTILFAGILVLAYSTLLMSGFNLNISFDVISTSRIIMGIGMAMIFIPLGNMTLSSVPKERMANASAIYNLLRNLGGSVGIAVFTTILARRAQFQQFRFCEAATPYDTMYQLGYYKAQHLLQVKGVSAPLAVHGTLYQQMMMKATMAAYADVFYMCTVVLLCVTPMILFMRRPSVTSDVPMGH